MSSVYATEPASSGRVIFETTHGPLEIQLWCRECPTTTKLFLQLCIDGFYDDMIFHRIVSDFLIQTGALRQGNTKSAGFTKEYQNKIQAPTAMERRRYETHSRLRFNHRGQLAMALGVNDEDDEELQPQFFITLEEAPYLDAKHVLFGTCSGPTIFNALRIGKMAVDENHQPLDLEHAPRVKSIRIMENPIHTDVAPHASVPWRVEPEESKVAKKKKKRKGRKDLNVLSFGDELEMGEEDTGIKSSHDLLSSKTLSKAVDEEVKQVVASDEPSTKKQKPENVAEAEAEPEKEPKIVFSRPAPASTPAFAIQETIKNLSLPKPEMEKKAPKVSLVEARLARFKNKTKSKQVREEETMARLVAFKSKVRKEAAEAKAGRGGVVMQDDSLATRMARKAQTAEETHDTIEASGETYHGQVLEDEHNEVDDGNNWMGTRFKCRRHIDDSSRLDTKGGDGRDMNDYEVIDERSNHDKSRHHKRQHHHYRS